MRTEYVGAACHNLLFMPATYIYIYAHKLIGIFIVNLCTLLNNLNAPVMTYKKRENGQRRQHSR